jgi:hypothetical protein
MVQNYNRPSLKKIQLTNENILQTQYALTGLNTCEPENSFCQQEITSTVRFLFCAEGINDGALMNGCLFSAVSCPAEMTDCQTESDLQDNCEPIGGLAVSCSMTFDCTASCGGTPTFGVTCGGAGEIPCPTVG